MEFNVLGPLEVVDDDRVVTLGSGRQTLLAHCLLLHRNDVVSRDRGPALADVMYAPFAQAELARLEELRQPRVMRGRTRTEAERPAPRRPHA
ncbi:MAG: hypothetical protein M5U27_03185 [Gaiella sp.]|nr:hypothetical protein [Gaiella sp.]